MTFDTYHYEKMMQFSQAEQNRQNRSGWHLRTMAAGAEDSAKRTDGGAWHRWFGSKRLTTSSK